MSTILYNFVTYNKDKLNWVLLSQNPSAIPFLEEYPDKIDSLSLSSNPNAIGLLEKYPDKIKWSALSSNPNAIHLLEQNIDKINWKSLSLNPNAIDLLKQNQDKINWKNLSLNPNAIDIINNNLDKINWKNLSKNPNSFEILKKNPDKIDFENIHPDFNFIYLFDTIPLNIINVLSDNVLFNISKNHHAFDFLAKNETIIHPESLFKNEKICDFEKAYPTIFSNLILNDIENLTSNKFAIPLIEKYFIDGKIEDEIEDDQELIGLSSNPNAIHLLKKYPFLIIYDKLSANPNAIEILEENFEEFSNENCGWTN